MVILRLDVDYLVTVSSLCDILSRNVVLIYHHVKNLLVFNELANNHHQNFFLADQTSVRIALVRTFGGSDFRHN